jgi:dimethylhistidine N-methyltransferase
MDMSEARRETTVARARLQMPDGMLGVGALAAADLDRTWAIFDAPDAPQETNMQPAGAVEAAFRHDVLRGLHRFPKAIPARWFYDHRGSELFEEITALPEYYPSRTERGILRTRAADIAALTGKRRVVVEFGAGSCAKTPLLLSAVQASAYVPIDISGPYLAESSAKLARLFPGLEICPLEADFTLPLRLPERDGAPCLGFFPGSTIGNLVPESATRLLSTLSHTLGPEAQLLIGIDATKSEAMLIPAYDDARGVTAAFNLNLLRRINRELGGSIPLDEFTHVVRWNDYESRIEMHLQVRRAVAFDVAGVSFRMAAGETIHTENCTKYSGREARLLLRSGGWSPVGEWSDPSGWFTVILAQTAPPHEAP